MSDSAMPHTYMDAAKAKIDSNLEKVKLDFSQSFAKAKGAYNKIVAAGEINEESLEMLDRGLAKRLEFKCSILLASLKGMYTEPAAKVVKASGARTVLMTKAKPPMAWSTRFPEPSDAAIVQPVSVEVGAPEQSPQKEDTRRTYSTQGAFLRWEADGEGPWSRKQKPKYASGRAGSGKWEQVDDKLSQKREQVEAEEDAPFVAVIPPRPRKRYGNLTKDLMPSPSQGRSETRCRGTSRKGTSSRSHEDLRQILNTTRSRAGSKCRDPWWPIAGGCRSCGAKDYHKFTECPAANVKCSRCDVTGHYTSVCNSGRRTEEKNRRDKSKGSRDRRNDREDSALRARKRDCMRSQMAAKPRKPRRRDHVTTSPWRRQHEKKACGSDDDLDLVVYKRATVTPLTQTYEGMKQTNPSLPIRSLLDPGTPQEQVINFLSDDPTRLPEVLKSIAKWRKFLGDMQDNPVDIEGLFNEFGRQKVAWWRKYLVNGAGICVVDGVIRPRHC